MRILGAIFAGGQARRFGSDKAMALLNDRPLIAHVAERLSAQAADLVICGRQWNGYVGLDDRPCPDMGPLGALCAALHHATQYGFDAVLTSGCDLPDLPIDLAACLAPPPSLVKGQPLLGLWPSELSPLLDDYLAASDDLSMTGWRRHCSARIVEIGRAVANINTPGDLAMLRLREDLQSSR